LIRPERPEDTEAVRAVVAGAFGPPRGVHLLLDDLRRSVAWVDLSFVAVEGDEVVGHVAYSRAWVDAPLRLVDVLVLSPLSVRPDRQRQGIGSRLVRESFQALQERPEPVVFLEGDPAYYGRLGFEPAVSCGFSAPSVRIPAPAFQLVTLPSYDEGLTGALVYPDVWWRHDAVGLRG
jgi:putative acetyltransferase